MINFKSAFAYSGAAIYGLALTACSAGFQSVDFSSRAKLFTQTTAGSGDNGSSGSGTTTGSGSGGSGSGGSGGSGGSSGNGTTTGGTIPVTTYCDTLDTQAAGTNVYSAASVTLVVKDSSGTVACTITNAQSDIELAATGDGLNLAACGTLTPGTYKLTLTAPGASQNLLIANSDETVMTESSGTPVLQGNLQISKDAVPVTLAADGTWSSSQDIYVLWDTNPNKSATNPGNASCASEGQSPLIIDLNARASKADLVNLTTIDSGVLFNILGDNAVDFGLPANTPVKISWFKDMNYGFLALPNADGTVNGIDQLFGNNTKLPDGTFKANGYSALAYYDENHDGVINQKDAIFSKLRIWKTDVDNYGIATQKLVTLGALGITEINLKYTNAKGNEKLASGNKVAMQSTVTFADGKHDMYDLWFRVKLPEVHSVMQPLAKR